MILKSYCECLDILIIQKDPVRHVQNLSDGNADAKPTDLKSVIICHDIFVRTASWFPLFARIIGIKRKMIFLH